MKSAALFVIVLVLLAQVRGQDLPNKIRGYKIQNANITIVNSSGQPGKDDGSDAFVKLDNPRITSIGLFGAGIEIGAEITALRQNGRVEFITFRDFRVNGIAVEVEEHKHPFSFKKEKSVTLPKPARVSISLASLPRAAYNELFKTSHELSVTGTMFVFGKFKKFGFGFKRVIPVKIDLKVKNPLYS